MYYFMHIMHILLIAHRAKIKRRKWHKMSVRLFLTTERPTTMSKGSQQQKVKFQKQAFSKFQDLFGRKKYVEKHVEKINAYFS